MVVLYPLCRWLQHWNFLQWQDSRMAEVGRNLRDTSRYTWTKFPAQSTCCLQQVTQDIKWSNFEYVSGWRLHSLSVHFMPMFSHCNSETNERKSTKQNLLCSHCHLSFHWAPLKRFWLHLLYSSATGIHTQGWDSPNSSILKNKKSQLSQPLLLCHVI